MADIACSVEGCGRDVNCRGWCKKHYERWRRHGDPHGGSRAVGDEWFNFAMKVDVGHPLGCWIWTGAYGSHGYGGFAGTTAHRAAFEMFLGPIPPGLEIDHLCRNRKCVNPDHLEAVTRSVNVSRGAAVFRMQRHNPGAATAQSRADRSHCANGHAYSGDNFYYRDGARICRVCRNERVNAWRERQKASA